MNFPTVGRHDKVMVLAYDCSISYSSSSSFFIQAAHTLFHKMFAQNSLFSNVNIALCTDVKHRHMSVMCV